MIRRSLGAPWLLSTTNNRRISASGRPASSSVTSMVCSVCSGLGVTPAREFAACGPVTSPAWSDTISPFPLQMTCSFMRFSCLHRLGEKLTEQVVLDRRRAIIDHADVIRHRAVEIALDTLIDEPELAAGVVRDRLDHDELWRLLEPPPPTIRLTWAAQARSGGVQPCHVTSPFLLWRRPSPRRLGQDSLSPGRRDEAPQEGSTRVLQRTRHRCPCPVSWA